jgi:hypothetical protein
MAMGCCPKSMCHIRQQAERPRLNWRTIISAESASTTPGPVTDGLGENDHDLLTFSEARGRLQAEITRAAEHIAELRAADDTDGVAHAQQRLVALQEAARRVDDRRINDATFEKFFGYRARREGGRAPTA